MLQNNRKQQNKITCYNIFIKDSFNIIYNRASLNFLPKHIKDDIIKYKNKNACLVVIELAKIWNNFNNKKVILKYKILISKYKYFTNNMYENIIINKIDIFYLCLNINLSIIYILCFYKFLNYCLGTNIISIKNISPTPTLKIIMKI